MAALLAFLLLLSPESERMLLGPSPFFRHEGMQRAVRDGDEALLLRAADSPHWDARRLAAVGLGRKTPLKLLEDPLAVVREAAVSALDTAAPERRLLELLKDKDDAVRAAAVWALRARTSKTELRPLVRDPSPTVRIAALAATGNFARLRALSRREALAESVPALYALGRAGGASDASLLLSRLNAILRRKKKRRVPLLYLRERPGPEIALARAIGDIARRGVTAGGKSVADSLRRTVQKAKLFTSDGILLAEAIAGARDAAGAQRILDAQLRARKKSTLPNALFQPAVRGILHAFSREPWPELAPLLFPLLQDRDVSIRLAVVGALRGTAVQPALRDASPEVRAAACLRVGKLAPLLALADADGSALVLAACARALGHLGDRKGVPMLEKLGRNEDSTVRHAVVGALLRLSYDGRSDLLYRAATRDESLRVRAASASVLSFLEDKTILPRAVADLLAGSFPVRRNTVALLHALTAARHGYDPGKPQQGAGRWAEWLKRKARRPRKVDAFRYHVEDLRRRGIDLVLVLDATGSMAPVIQATKRRLEVVLERLRRIVPDLRARVIAYRDAGDAFTTIGSPLTHEPRILEDFLACIPAAGGGDGPEAVLAGLREAIDRTPWRNNSHRIVLLFGDAPPHQRDLALLEVVLKEFKGVVHTVDVSGYGLNRQAWGGIAGPFRSLAKWGRGSFVRLATDHDLLRDILVLTLGPAHRAAVEALFGL